MATDVMPTPRQALTKRNHEICRLYHDGKTLQEIGDHFKLSRERVRGILLQLNVLTKKRPVVKTGRDEFLGVNISEADKTKLRAEAEKRGISMSALTSDLIHDMLATED